MADVASKQQITVLFLSTIVTRTRHTELTKKTDKPDGKPVLCQSTFSSAFRAVYFNAQFNLERVGPYRQFRDRLRLHHQGCDGNRDAVPETSIYFNNLTKTSDRDDLFNLISQRFSNCGPRVLPLWSF